LELRGEERRRNHQCIEEAILSVHNSVDRDCLRKEVRLLRCLNKQSLKLFGDHHFYKVEDCSFIYKSVSILNTNSNLLISSDLAL
jgi:hypothetical protein